VTGACGSALSATDYGDAARCGLAVVDSIAKKPVTMHWSAGATSQAGAQSFYFVGWNKFGLDRL